MSDSRTEPNPPSWAEHLLRLLLDPEHRESVSGDLLEEYRAGVVPARGRVRADLWYLRQVVGFAWRAAWLWAVLLTASVIGRDALDWWLSPTNEFYARSIASTAIAVGLFASAGALTAWRTRSIRSGVVAGLATGLIAAAFVNAASLVMLAVNHDPHTMAMIRASGGLSEALTLPLLVTLPGTICALLGAVAGKTIASVLRPQRV
jgi:hypothetical protein